MMKFDIPPLRIALYFALALFSFIVFALSAARLHYTTHLPSGDPLNNGHSFYDPVVAELLFTTLITMAWSGYIIHTIHKRRDYNIYVSSFTAELVGIFIIWLFWLAGTSVATSFWGNLSFCWHFHACRLLSALVAFAWLTWILLTAIFVITLLFSIANKATMEPLHGRWDPRASNYRDSRGV